MPDTTAGTAGRPWDQLASETDEEYSRFLVYLNLGVGRSLDAAFEASRAGRGRRSGRGRQRDYQAWLLEAARHRWRERAVEWDISRVPAMLQQAAVNLAALKAEIAAKALEACPRRRH
jgi:hypothetical protein